MNIIYRKYDFQYEIVNDDVLEGKPISIESLSPYTDSTFPHDVNLSDIYSENIPPIYVQLARLCKDGNNSYESIDFNNIISFCNQYGLLYEPFLETEINTSGKRMYTLKGCTCTTEEFFHYIPELKYPSLSLQFLLFHAYQLSMMFELSSLLKAKISHLSLRKQRYHSLQIMHVVISIITNPYYMGKYEANTNDDFELICTTNFGKIVCEVQSVIARQKIINCNMDIASIIISKRISKDSCFTDLFKHFCCIKNKDLYVNAASFEYMSTNSPLYKFLADYKNDIPKMALSFFNDCLYEEIKDVRPIFDINNKNDFDVNWYSPSLYSAIYFNYYLENTSNSVITRCALPSCNNFFSKPITRGNKKYCCDSCAKKNAKMKYNERQKRHSACSTVPG